MGKLISGIMWLVVVFGVASSGISGEPPGDAAGIAADPVGQTTVLDRETTAPVEVPPLDPWRQEILDLRRATAERLAELQAAFDAESDPMRRLELENAMRALKQSAQLRVLAIQVHELRSRGAEDSALELEKAIEFLKAERGTGEPLRREDVKRMR